MAYTTTNFKTKKALKEAVERGEQISLYSHAGIFKPATQGTEYIEGPHYPEPHKWYAQVEMKDGIIQSVK